MVLLELGKKITKALEKISKNTNVNEEDLKSCLN